jgi:hypothetical protein
VPALIERHHPEVRLQGNAQRVPCVRVSREAMQEQERHASFAAPVEQVKLQALDDELAIERSQKVHGGAQDTRIPATPLGAAA